ncbi:hypothetical protein A3E42_03140 [Candidatus Gottesmanbacteria bacterium RIFCSPHIGHO2_12_FULL_40_13]|uniref:Uncharacterized protein n=1 Tax=Candidatus Gottesmanbacteria bacterium RIFCSPHIGHO2_01_FULL_40_15 TaxID=1798376 RepID=A0A1F5Z1C0_9BACT|nr:MAG: hypothetical protein A2777_06535 [Candidatus Gottesmanbacteria bacterium RIFCSPHIGHO2_01_FULL_40_15]OGG23363.1 MAG: hypothetical protein A3E42_03140 [Candidatus Gottesmanbacteria bacterium RIFCSPHIGHO2_12_FULL_40_13]OGG34023.1 MAG: hypothetical protein A3I80_04355 [Candidatus Gottesmanbacteria bacterium RIFCSPLOWO2_02_FULL_40_10]
MKESEYMTEAGIPNEIRETKTAQSLRDTFNFLKSQGKKLLEEVNNSRVTVMAGLAPIVGASILQERNYPPVTEDPFVYMAAPLSAAAVLSRTTEGRYKLYVSAGAVALGTAVSLVTNEPAAAIAGVSTAAGFGLGSILRGRRLPVTE